MGGSVRVESNLGIGTTFIMQLKTKCKLSTMHPTRRASLYQSLDPDKDDAASNPSKQMHQENSDNIVPPKTPLIRKSRNNIFQNSDTVKDENNRDIAANRNLLRQIQTFKVRRQIGTGLG